MLRAFIAIKLSDELKGHIGEVQAELKRRASGLDGLGWVRPEGMHLTLRFLGDIAGDQVEALEALLGDVAAGMKPFTLEARGIGVFPNPRAPRVIWLGLQGTPESMASLRRMQAGIEDGVVGLGFPREPREFTAHLTLARVRDRQSGAALAKVLEANEDRAVGAFVATSVGLIKSELRPTGAAYTTLVEVPFGGGV
ncbi:MAG: RNA 2',3'-cyclic phosphodiesterase [Nitrospirae bacterium]|nr:MAG: RNA 2',3'-cyclic phosphodiesterase [Nitrospirota bacterium]